MFLASKRLYLRVLEPEDLDVLYKWENDMELWQYGSSLTPYSKFALKEYIRNSDRDILQTRQLRLMIADKLSDEAIGTVDLYDYDSINQRAGIGILLDSKHRNKGLGAEVLSLIEKYAFRYLFLEQLYAHIPARNEMSYKLFSKCGYEQTGILKNWLKTESGFEDVVVMQRGK